MSHTLQQPPPRTKRLPLLDGLRGIAAIGVMLYHVGTVFGFYSIFSRSYLFVDFFFLLSGFVLALAAEPKLNAGLTAAGFMRARIKRLWPLIAVGASIGALQYGTGTGWGAVPLLLVLAFLLLPALHGPSEIFPLNGPQWSLLLELLANLGHALVLKHLSQRSLLIFVAVSGAALAATIFHFGSNTLGPFAHNWLFALPRVFFAYGLGVWLARCWQTRARSPVISWEAALILPVLMMVLLALTPMSVAIGDAAVALIGMPVLFWLAALAPVPPRAGALLDRLGSISFPLYAVHLPILLFYGRFGDAPGLVVSAITSALAAALLLALLLESKYTSQAKRGAAPAAAQEAA